MGFLEYFGMFFFESECRKFKVLCFLRKVDIFFIVLFNIINIEVYVEILNLRSFYFIEEISKFRDFVVVMLLFIF